VLVVAAAERLAHLGFQRFLDDLADRELEELGPRVAVGHAVREQLMELLACPLRGRYSRGHGEACSCRRRQPACLGFESKQECIPVSFSSKSRTSAVWETVRTDSHLVSQKHTQSWGHLNQYIRAKSPELLPCADLGLSPGTWHVRSFLSGMRRVQDETRPG